MTSPKSCIWERAIKIRKTRLLPETISISAPLGLPPGTALSKAQNSDYTKQDFGEIPPLLLMPPTRLLLTSEKSYIYTL